MSFGSRLQRSAERLVERFGEGRSVKLTHVITWTTDPATRTKVADETEEWTLPAVQSSFSVEEISASATGRERNDQRLIRSTDKRFLIASAPDELPSEPGPDWKLFDVQEGVSYTIVTANAKKPGPVTIYRDLQVRR